MSGAGYRPDYWDAVRTGQIDPPDCLGCNDRGVIDGEPCACTAGQRAAKSFAKLLDDALDLVPRMGDDDPIAPALTDWCKRVRRAKATGSQS